MLQIAHHDCFARPRRPLVSPVPCSRQTNAVVGMLAGSPTFVLKQHSLHQAAGGGHVHRPQQLRVLGIDIRPEFQQQVDNLRVGLLGSGVERRVPVFAFLHVSAYGEIRDRDGYRQRLF